LDTGGEGLGAIGAWELAAIRVKALFNPATANDDISVFDWEALVLKRKEKVLTSTFA
jgi:hypothetical protein